MIKQIPNSLGIKRGDMPQINANLAIHFLLSRGLEFRAGFLKASEIKMTQCEYNEDRVQNKLKGNIEDLMKPLILSAGGNLLDGHNTVIALMRKDPDFLVPCLVTCVAIDKLLEHAHAYEYSYVKSIHKVD